MASYTLHDIDARIWKGLDAEADRLGQPIHVIIKQILTQHVTDGVSCETADPQCPIVRDGSAHATHRP